jgi:hypothetical protein
MNITEEIIHVHPFDLFELLLLSDTPVTKLEQTEDTVTIDGTRYFGDMSVPYKGEDPEFLAVLAQAKS